MEPGDRYTQQLLGGSAERQHAERLAVCARSLSADGSRRPSLRASTALRRCGSLRASPASSPTTAPLQATPPGGRTGRAPARDQALVRILSSLIPEPCRGRRPHSALSLLSNRWQHLAGDADAAEGKAAAIQVNSDMNLFVTELGAGKALPFHVKAGRNAYVVCLEGAAALRGSGAGARPADAAPVLAAPCLWRV